MKTKEAKQVNRCVKKLNKQLRDDVFGDRFEARQVQKGFGDGIEYFLYMLNTSSRVSGSKYNLSDVS